MKNKGFTLIELLATLVIISIVSVISVLAVNKVSENSRLDFCNTQVKNIKSAAMLWASDNKILLPTTDENEVLVKLSDLQNGNIDINSSYSGIVLTLNDLEKSGYIDQKCDNEKCYPDVYDPINKEYISGDTKITIWKSKKTYNYNVDYYCNK